MGILYCFKVLYFVEFQGHHLPFNGGPDLYVRVAWYKVGEQQRRESVAAENFEKSSCVRSVQPF